LAHELPELPVLQTAPDASWPPSVTLGGPSLPLASTGKPAPLELVAPELEPLEVLATSASGEGAGDEPELAIELSSPAEPLEPPLV
jgi:hypothetical protein